MWRVKVNDDKTTLTCTNNYGHYSISINSVDLSIFDVKDELLWPLLLSMGFMSETVEEILGERV